MGIWKTILFWVCLLILTAAGILLYKPMLRQMALNGDNAENYRDTYDRDTVFTIFDPLLITTSKGANTYFCPMQSITWLGLVRFLKPESIYYQGFGLLIHLTCALLAACLARSLLSSGFWGVASGALFLVYVYHASTLNFVSAVITHGLCVMFYLAALLAFVSHLRTKKLPAYLLTILFFLLAHLSKETAWSLLPTMMALEYFLFLPAQAKKVNLDNLIGFTNKYWPFAIIFLGALSIFLLKFPYGNIVHSWGGTSLSVNILYRFFDLLCLLITPKIVSVTSQIAILNIIIFVIAASVFHGSAPLRFFFLWIAMAILPYCLSNFRPTAELTRYLYLASVPFSILLSHGAIWARSKRFYLRVPLTLLPLAFIGANLYLNLVKVWRL